MPEVPRSMIEEWDRYYRSGEYRREWHLKYPSSELRCLLSTGLVPPGRAVDMGCGAGTEAVHLARSGFDTTAVDVSPLALDKTARLARFYKVEVRVHLAAVPDTGLPERSFTFLNDRSCLFCIAPERRLWEGYAREAARILQPGGIMLSRRFGQIGSNGRERYLDRATFEEIFSPFFEIGPIQEAAFRVPHVPSLIAVLKRR